MSHSGPLKFNSNDDIWIYWKFALCAGSLTGDRRCFKLSISLNRPSYPKRNRVPSVSINLLSVSTSHRYPRLTQNRLSIAPVPTGCEGQRDFVRQAVRNVRYYRIISTLVYSVKYQFPGPFVWDTKRLPLIRLRSPFFVITHRRSVQFWEF